MTQPIRTIAAYYETEGRNAVNSHLAQELFEGALEHIAPHVGQVAVNWQGLHIPEEPLDVLSPYLDTLEDTHRHVAFFTKGSVEYRGGEAQGVAIPIGQGGWMRSRQVVQVPRIRIGRHTWLKALTLHELGHSFSSAEHCAQEECIMHEDLYVLDARRKISNDPFCDNCINDLHQTRATILRQQADQHTSQEE